MPDGTAVAWNLGGMDAVTPLYTESVLIAEDNQAMRELLAAHFRKAGIAVEVVETGQQLKRKLKPANGHSWLPKVVVSDIYMPGKTGLEVLRWLHRHFSDVHVILITAFGDECTHRRAKKLGAVAVLDKPFALDELLTLVAELLQQDQQQSEA